MKNNFLQEIIVSLALIILLVLFLNPLWFWMPSTLVMMMVLGFVVVFIIFTGFIWKETVRDEREDFHRMKAGRVAFLAGMTVLVAGIVTQSFKHNLDAWLVGALGAMILAKISGLIYGRTRN